MQPFRYALQCAILLCVSLFSGNAQTWVPLSGPNILNSVRDITINSNGDILFGADAAYVLKSTNSGTVWGGTASDFASPLVVLCRPNDASFVMTGRQNTFQLSTNGGGTWGSVTPTSIADNLTPLRLAVSPVSTSNIFLGRQYHGSTNSFWRSTNGGVNWATSTNFTWETHVYDIAPYPVGDGTRNNWLWVSGSSTGGSAPESNPNATASVRGVWYSPDAGVTWQPKSLGDFDLRAITVIHKASPANPHLYAGTSSGSVYKSTDLGDTWSSVFSGGSVIRAIRINTSNSYIFVAANNGVHRSTNEGTNWTQVIKRGRSFSCCALIRQHGIRRHHGIALQVHQQWGHLDRYRQDERCLCFRQWPKGLGGLTG